MRFRDVVLCDGPDCGAILRISTVPGPISVKLQQDGTGTFIECPRCNRRTLIEPPVDGVSEAAGIRAA
jgi:hypothetical protein